MVMRILLVEDDRLQRDVASSWLEHDGHAVKGAASVAEAVKALQRDSFDLVILDWMLPNGSGTEILHWVRERLPKLPVMFATAKDEEGEIASILRSGADDYVVKPLRRAEFLARVEALGRRTGRLPPPREQVIEHGAYRLDPGARSITVEGRAVKLTPRMFDIAMLFFRREGELISRAELYERFWGTKEPPLTRSADTHVSRIRSALQLDGRHGMRLSSVYHHGYRLEALSHAKA
jgi:DNA-binding response OmpR family regulator